jgi:phosphatidylserine decarboxylase
LIFNDTEFKAYMLLQAIQYYNRYNQKLEVELVYGEKWLRWAYTHPIGAVTVYLLLKRSLLSHLYGWRMNSSWSQKLIKPFIQKYGIDIASMETDVAAFTSFNDFFYRKLKKHSRPINSDIRNVCFPADGRHLGFQDLSKVKGIFVKGQTFDLKGLLKDHALAERFKEGAAVLSRLCPTDYHRFHFPVSGIASAPKLINGSLGSVNPLALRKNIRILWENKRVLTLIQTESIGLVVMLEIGATFVGSIRQTYTANEFVEKGAEKGYFEFGGSSTLLLFEKGRVLLDADLVEQTERGYELYAHMGDHMSRGL